MSLFWTNTSIKITVMRDRIKKKNRVEVKVQNKKYWLRMEDSYIHKNRCRFNKKGESDWTEVKVGKINKKKWPEIISSKMRNKHQFAHGIKKSQQSLVVVSSSLNIHLTTTSTPVDSFMFSRTQKSKQDFYCRLFFPQCTFKFRQKNWVLNIIWPALETSGFCSLFSNQPVLNKCLLKTW